MKNKHRSSAESDIDRIPTSASLSATTGAVNQVVINWQVPPDNSASSDDSTLTQQGRSEQSSPDYVAQEVAVALVYNGVSHVVMMVTPVDLEAFALGFSLTEGIIDRPADIYTIELLQHQQGLELAISLSNRCFTRLKARRRNLAGRTGCGICGAESLQQMRLPSALAKVHSDYRVSHAAINLATDQLLYHQPLQQLTGAVHGAAWCDTDGAILMVCEDVGRHNALDKLIGRLWEQNSLQQPGFLLISSRASYEMLQKAATAGIAVVVAASAPTSLAIDVAKEVGISLVGFSRQNRHVVYSNDWRFL